MAGKYQAYPEYKDSGLEWLGAVPQDWSVTRLKYTALIFGRIGFRGYTVNDIVDEGEGAIVLSPSNIDDDCFTLKKKAYLSWDKYYESPEIMVEPDDVLLVKTGSTFGKSTIVKEVDEPMTINPQMALIKKSNIDSRFLTYLLNSALIKAKIDVNNTGSGMPTMTQENINSFPVPRPSDNLAVLIANFLDNETAKIDTLIEKQQQLIKLLKEKRQAVISHAVTKGLSNLPGANLNGGSAAVPQGEGRDSPSKPRAPMRDSGVEWLGEVPAHWKISRIKNVVTAIVDGPHFSPKYQEDGYMFISARNIKVDRWSLGDAKYISEEDFNEFNKRVRPEKGDVLLTKGGTTGIARAVDLDFPFQVWVHVAVLKIIHSKVNPFYMAYVLNGTACYEQSQLYTHGATNNDLGLSRIAKIFFALPPLEEQKEMVSWLDEKCTKFDLLINKGIESIKLMQERRTALISAAVTGKIDVRNWKAPEQTKIDKEVAA